MGTNGTVAMREARRLFDAGLTDFRAGRYFEAHDIWEELWQHLRGPDRLFLQALIHLAVGAYHHENGNRRGAASQWRKADTKLGRYPEGHWGIDVSEWRRWIGGFLGDRATSAHPHDLPFVATQFPEHLPLAPGSFLE